MLRPHQSRFDQICNSINNGSPISEVLIYAKPASGKSLLPAIASQLINDDNTKLLWIVPRDALRTQGEADFRGSGHYDVGDKDIRSADGIGDVFRGNCGAITTYQSVSANHDKFIELSLKYKLILFLDEYDSLVDDSSWMIPIKQIYNNSFFKIAMTGTISRSNRQKISFTPYLKNGEVDFSETDTRKWIVYDTKQAVKDGSILEFNATLVQGSGSYIDLNGITRNFNKFTGDGNQLKCAFTTEFAFSLFNLGLKHWKEYRVNHPWSKFLVIATNIEIAKQYYKWFTDNGYRFAIATSEDSSDAKLTMKRFKRDNKHYDSYDGLISVSMIYKGMNCPECSHLIALTNVRGSAYLDQSFGRIQRKYKEKKRGYLFTTDDPKMRKILKNLACGYIESAEDFTEPKTDNNNSDNPTGITHTIEALSSKAHINGLPLFPDFNPEPVQIETQSEIEHRLRGEINTVINRVVGSASTGNKNVVSRIFWMKVKLLVSKGRNENGKLIRKPISEMTIKELKIIAKFCENYK